MDGLTENKYIEYIQGASKSGMKEFRIMTDKRLETSDQGLFSYPIEMEDLVAYKELDPNVRDIRRNKDQERSQHV
jgi:hypothetical protein